MSDVSAYWRLVLLFAAVFGGLGWFILRGAALRRRALAIVVGGAVTVGVRYLDWNSREPSFATFRLCTAVRFGLAIDAGGALRREGSAIGATD